MQKRTIWGNLVEFYRYVLRKYVKPKEYRQEQAKQRQFISNMLYGSAFEMKRKKQEMEEQLSNAFVELGKSFTQFSELTDIVRCTSRSVCTQLHARDF